MSYRGIGKLCALTRKLNAELYVYLLQRYLYPEVQRIFPGNDPVYIIEDNSPVHTARIVRDWYTAHNRLIRLPHPPRSPDLNPIENMWARMVHDWKGDVAHDVNQIQERVQLSWTKLGDEGQFFRNLMDSMPRRFQAVIDNNRSYIHY